MYSQNDEESVIVGVFDGVKNGRFLDVGAFDGRTFSNTRRLWEIGWSGVCVEPSPNAFAGLQRHYEGDDRVDLIQAAIADRTGTVTFFDSGGDAISSTSTDHCEKWVRDGSAKYEEIQVESISFDDLFQMCGSDYDFVNIDTEATNLEILRLFPFDKCVPKCLCIEHDRAFDAIMDILSPHGFKEIHRNGENTIYVR